MINQIEKRIEKVTRLRDNAMNDKYPHKFKQAQYLIDKLHELKNIQSSSVSNKLKQIYSY